MYTTKTQANQELKKIMSDFNESYKLVCAQSRDEYIKTLKPGSPLPTEGTIYTENRKSQFSEECNKYRAKAHEIINAHIDELKRKETDAPSTEAVNTITLLKLRDNVSEKEISELLERYGDNPQAYRAINSIAFSHDIKSFGDHPISESLENLEALSSGIDKVIAPWNKNISDGYIAMFNLQIDSAFPEE